MDAVLRREGDVWAIGLDGRTVRVRDSRGMQHLSVLLSRPNTEVHVLDLAGAPGAVTSADAGRLLDDVARAAYKERLSDLAGDLDEADRFNDPERSARIQAEIDAIVDQLTSASGLGGKDRGAVTDAERARVAVRRAVKAALDRITKAHPALGAHLAATVRTGTFCSYVPDPASPLRWVIGGDVASPAAPDAQRPAPVARPVVVGRTREQAQLRDAWATGGIVLVSGEPGIGKTTLLRDLEADVPLALHGRCDEHVGVAYQPFVEAIRTLVDLDGAATVVADAGVGATALARLVPELGAVATSADSAETERLILFDAIVDVLAAADARRRVLLVVDDLHWAPQPTLSALLYVLRDLRGALVVLSHRDTDVTPELAAFLAAIARLEDVSRLPLEGIDTGAIVELGASVDDAKRIADHTNGNPFFVRALLESPLDVALPSSVVDVVHDRLRRLSEPAQRFAALVAVAERVELRVAVALGTVESVDELLAAGLLVEEHARLTISHALVGRAITESASGLRRAELHREVATALERAGAPAAELAYHWAEAAILGDPAPAVRWAIAAADVALRTSAFEEAVAHADRGLALVADASVDHAELLLRLGSARHAGGDVLAAGDALRRAAVIASTHGAWSLLADVTLERALGGGQVGVFDAELAVALQDACDHLGETDPPRRARLLARLAIEESGGGRIDQAREIADDAVRLARSCGDPTVLLVAVRAQYVVLDGPDHLDERVGLASELDRLATVHGGLEVQIQAKGMVATLAAELGDVEAMDAALAVLRVLVRTARLPRQDWYELQLAVLRHLIDGDLDAAEETAARELEVGAAASVPNALRGYGLQLMIIRDAQGRAGELADVAVGMVGDGGEPATMVMAALACARVDRSDDARALLDRVDLDAMPRDGLFVGSLCGAAELAFALDDPAAAAVVDRLLRPLSGRTCVIALGTAAMGPVDRYLSITARVLGERDRAEHHLAAAVVLDERMRARRWLERDRADLASLIGSTV